MTNNKLIIFTLISGLIFGFSTIAADKSEWRIVTEIAPPYQSYINDELQGIALDKVRPVLAQAGIVADIEVFPWARAFQLAKTQKNTIIFSMVRLEEREPYFHWIGLVEQARLSFFSLATNKGITINSIEDAKKWSIGAVRNDFNHQYLSKTGFAENEHFILRSHLTEVFELLLLNRIDLMLADMAFMDLIIEDKNLKQSDIKIHFQPNDAVRDIYIAVNKDSDAHVVALLTQLFADSSSKE